MRESGQVEHAARELRRRRAARDSLLSFTEYTYQDWETGWHHSLLCEWLERLESKAPCPHCGKRVRMLAVHMPPRHSKTELASRRFPAWYLGRHPKRLVIAASATEDLAGEIGSDVRDIVREQEYQRIFPGAKIRKDKDAAGKWRLESGAIFFTVGAGGTCVGRGAHLLIIDDPHGGRNKAESPRDRKRVADWYFGDMRQRLQRPISVLLILTRWHDDDLAGQLMPPEKEWEQADSDGFIHHAGRWHVIKMPAILNEGTSDERALWPGKNDRKDFEPSESDPDNIAGFPLWYLRELRDELTEKGKARDWQSQYQQNPTPEEGLLLKREWYADRWSPRKGAGLIALPEQLNIYVGGDLAVTNADVASHRPDNTELGVFGIGPDDRLYVIDWFYGAVEPDVWVKELLRIFKKHRPSNFFAESGLIRRATEGLLMRSMRDAKIYGPVDEESWVPTTKDKKARATALRAWSRARRIIFPEDRYASWVPHVIEQLVGFPTVRYDDAFDVCSIVTSKVDLLDAKPKASVRKPYLRKRYQRSGGAYGRRRGGWRTV